MPSWLIWAARTFCAERLPDWRLGFARESAGLLNTTEPFGTWFDRTAVEVETGIRPPPFSMTTCWGTVGYYWFGSWVIPGMICTDFGWLFRPLVPPLMPTPPAPCIRFGAFRSVAMPGLTTVF